jgi:phosphatidylserine/phosphatidylglycerophosphate/cardiolipin synthase-like enzyme
MKPYSKDVQVHFKDIQLNIIRYINLAETDLKIAVAWFNNSIIFDCLINKLKEIKISLIISNDGNNYGNEINFQHFINKGGLLYLPYDNKLMHNKYLIIDNKIILTGSYNFTYGAERLNHENLIIIENNKSISDSYITNFDRLVNLSNIVSDFNHSINHNVELQSNLIAKPETELFLISPENLRDEDLIAYSIFEQYNLGKIKTEGRAIVKSIEDKLPFIQNNKLIFATCLALYSTGENKLADMYFEKIKNTTNKSFLQTLATFELKIDFI